MVLALVAAFIWEQWDFHPALGAACRLPLGTHPANRAPRSPSAGFQYSAV